MAGTKVSEKGIFHCILNLYIKITMQHPTGFPSNKIYIFPFNIHVLNVEYIF